MIQLNVPTTFHIASWKGLLLGLIACILLSFLKVLLKAFYNFHLHPLRKIPGPSLWIAFPILRNLAQLQGQFDRKIHHFHETYGKVVRWAPNEVTFISAQAWKDIYGHGHPELPKFYPKGSGMNEKTPKIISANAPDHFRFRRAMLPAFSDKALSQQEPLIRVYIDLLIEKLCKVASSNATTDMVKWYSLTTFDLIGDLAYGESFDGLKDAKSNDWIKNIERMMKLFPILTLVSEAPLLAKLFMFFLSDRIKNSKAKHLEQATALAMKRINNKEQAGRGDFMDYMMRSQGQKHGLTDAELASNSDTLIVAGSETTATLLSGVTYFLIANPSTLKKATDEVRSAFESEHDISFKNASARLPYMLACLDEGLRMFPAVPTVLEREVLPGPPTLIDGILIPEKTRVGVHHFATYQSKENFHKANNFLPERWLPESQTDPDSPFYRDNRDAFKPFSSGPRDCIGRNLAYHEMRLILARVLWKFNFTLSEKCKDWNMQRTFALWEKPPLLVKLEARDGA